MGYRESSAHEVLFGHILVGFKNEGMSESVDLNKVKEIWQDSSAKHTSGVFPTTVNRDLTRAQQIALCEFDGYTNPNVNDENFPVNGSGISEVNLELLQFDHVVTGDEALRLIDERGYRPATLSEQLAFGVKYKDEQKKYPIVALWSDWRDPDGHRSVPYLCYWNGERELDLGWLEDRFDTSFRFLVVCK